tara:strand:- start:241 stop:558 length:318 start_codon:yes stop_codon:yes gene_type:complete
VKQGDQKHKDCKPDPGQGGRKIAVTVNYQAQTQTMAFAPNTKVEDVLLWAISVFGIDASLATEMELAIAGEEAELAGGKPLASIAKGEKTLVLDLLRGDIANGCP